MLRLFGLVIVTLSLLMPLPARADRIADVITWPAGPAVIKTGNQIRVQWYYLIDAASGAQMFARPMKGGALAPNYSASGSPVYRGEGQASAEFTLSAPGDVDAIRIQIVSRRDVLLERSFPVAFRFAADPMGPAPMPMLRAVPLDPGARITGPLATMEPSTPTSPRLELRPDLSPLVTSNALRDLLRSGQVFQPSLRIPDVITLPDGEMQPMQTLMGPPPPYEVSMNASAWVQSLEQWLGFMTVMMGFDVQRLMGEGPEYDAYRQMELADDPSVYQLLQRRRTAIGNLLDGI